MPLTSPTSPTSPRHAAHAAASAALAALAALAASAASAALPSGQLVAQEVDITGYVEHTLQIDYAADVNEQLIDATKLRLDFTNGSLGGLEFRANINMIVNHGTVEYDARGYLPEEVVADLASFGIPPVFPLERQRTYLDNAFISWDIGPARLRAGKQQLAWGPGYSFNPTDLFHRKNILDPTYEKEGVAALRFDLTWGLGGRFTAIASPREDFGASGYAMRLGTHISSVGYDVAVTLHQVEDSTSVSSTTFLPIMQRRRAAGLELSGELLGLGVWFEGNFNSMELEEDFTRAVMGFDYTFESGLYFMAEGLYNGRAEAGSPYPTHDWLANLMFGEPVGSWWILSGLRQDISELTSGSMYLFASPDGSLMVNPRLDISIAQNADLVVFGGVTVGNESGSFPSGLYSLIARATVYF